MVEYFVEDVDNQYATLKKIVTKVKALPEEIDQKLRIDLHVEFEHDISPVDQAAVDAQNCDYAP